jgi:dihydrofolate reductase
LRKLFLWIMASLDGFTEGPNGELDWLGAHASSDEGYGALNHMISTVDTVLLGRANYEGFYHYWRPMASTPSVPKRDADFSRWLNGVQKIVYSKTLASVDWENTTLFHSIEPDDVLKLKQGPGRDIAVLTSTSVGQALARMGLIDEFRINIFPVVLGGGKPLFRDIQDRVNLKLVQAKVASSGVIACVYQKATFH